KGCKLHRTIVDRHNHIQPGTTIGIDLEADRKKFTVSPGGVVVVPSGQIRYYARDTRSNLSHRYAE
ncbi:hypothetical protein TI04_07820, partial [Achromatium sp. WMS2]